MTMTLPPGDASLGELLAVAQRRFGPIAFESVGLGARHFELPQIADMPAYLERLAAKAGPAGKLNLPLWAKIWPSCLVLSMFLERYPFPEGGTVLEVGAGTGLVGLSVAAGGRDVILSDLEPGALLFARIATLKNGLQDRVRVQQVDFTRDHLPEPCRTIIGCEVLYNEAHAAPLLAFLADNLAEGGEVVLAMDRVRTGKTFFSLARERFQILMKEVPVRDPETGAQSHCVLYRMRAKA
ncbi:MAG: methyltransferase [Desulfovibrionaceae bacterium]